MKIIIHTVPWGFITVPIPIILPMGISHGNSYTHGSPGTYRLFPKMVTDLDNIQRRFYLYSRTTVLRSVNRV